MTLLSLLSFFFFNDTATTEIYTLSLHDAFRSRAHRRGAAGGAGVSGGDARPVGRARVGMASSGRAAAAHGASADRRPWRLAGAGTRAAGRGHSAGRARSGA